jgi:phosphatidylserine decarboxylase
LSKTTDHLFVVLQRLLPAGLLGRIIYRISRCRIRWLKNSLIRGFAALYRINIEEAAEPVPDGYASLNAFFTRTLKPGSRPIEGDNAAICSPADGFIQNLGLIRASELLQAKGLSYSLTQLLGNDSDAASRYEGGAFLTIYLAPHNYHRVHAPLAGTVQEMHYVPGGRMAVNRSTARAVPGLFAANERLICHCRYDSGDYALVFVGAMNVACISTAWSGEVLPHRPREPRRWSYAGQQNIHLAKGDYMGQFELGSTVILLMPRKTTDWNTDLQVDQAIAMGRRVGTLRHGQTARPQ